MLDAKGCFMTSGRVFLLFVPALLIPAASFSQTIVSAHSGVVHYFEGTVSVDGQPLEPKVGKFYDIKPGSELRTERGRAEVMLTPGIMLRLDENSSIRMVTNQLANTRLEFVSGAAALDSRNAAPGEPITIAYKDYQMRFSRSGRYRMDAEPPRLKVEEGEADVLLHDKSVTVKAAEALPLTAKLVAHVEDHPIQDALDRWEQDRTATISADNTSAADSDNLSSTLSDPQSGAYDPGTGYYGTLSPDPYSGGSYGAGASSFPFWLYGYGPMMHGYMPIYVPYGVYRPLSPIRTGIIHSPTRTYSPTRTVLTPTRTAGPPVHIVTRPAIHR